LGGVSAIILVLTIGLLGIMFFFMSSLMTSTLDSTLQPLSKTAAHSITGNLNLMADRMFMIRDNAGITGEGATGETQRGAIKKAMSGIEFVWLGIYDASGTFVTGSDNSPKTIADSSIFSAMAETKNVVLSDPDEGPDGLEIDAGIPISGAGGEIDSYLVGAYNYEVLTDALGNIILGSKASVFIINPEGKIVGHRDSSFVTEGASLTDIYGDSKEINDMKEDMFLGETGVVHISNGLKGKGDDIFFSYSPVRGTLWSLVIAAPKSDYTAPMTKGITMGVIVAVVLLVISILVTSFIILGIQKPLKKATNRIAALAEGDLTANVEITHSNDEVETLSESLAGMVTDFKAYTGAITDILTKISSSDLDVEITDEFRGDFAVMKDSLNTIVDFLNNIMNSIRKASSEVYSSATFVSSNAADVQISSGSQAEKVSRLKNETEIISSNVTGIESSAERVSDLIDDVRGKLAEGEQHMGNLLAAMNSISKNSDEITKVNKFMEDISFQTNILALNAAVEAARAGAAGKGFSVVADEVRTLAARSGDSSKKTSEMIGNSQKSIEDGSVYVRQMDESIKVIGDLIGEISGLTEALKEAVGSQKDSLGVVSAQVDGISEMANSNLESSKNSASASRVLTEQADKLRAMAERFRLRGDQNE
jgi:methyl-accepting chemotaxis protein